MIPCSGTLGATVGRVTDFSGERRSSIGLDSTSFEFEIQTNDWSLGHIKLDYLDSRDPTLRPAQAALAAGVDRLSVDTAYISVGNPLRFPPQLAAGVSMRSPRSSRRSATCFSG